MIGTISVTGKGVGYIRVEGKEDSIVIEPENLNAALNGDTVEYEGEKVTKILARARTEFVGELRDDKGDIIMVPDDNRMYTAIVIPRDRLKGALPGHKVLVKMDPWSDPKTDPTGTVMKDFGKAGVHETEMQAIVAASGFEANFPPQVEAEAEAIPEEISEQEIKKRRDFRKILTFTIDPVDAKDFDDALSFLDLGNDTYEIGVHIADVSHYVREGTALDREAIKRATSIYLVDRTVPMLPERLSNNLCSLVPNKDRLTFSAVFKINNKGEVLESWFGKTIIHSQKRFTYENAQEVLDAGTGDYFRELDTMNRIAKTMREDRFVAGAIEFESDEIKFRLDEEGVPVAVYKKVRGDTHKMIEEYMLLANRRVAEFIDEKDKGRTFIYRNHDLPDIDRLANLASFVQNFGHTLKLKDNVVPARQLNDLMERVEDTPERNVIQTSVLRSMAKAVYSTKNIGHFGLAMSHYTHFTSPIRRYPDVMVHRLLFDLLEGRPESDRAKYEELAQHSTRREIEAVEAERASIKYKQVEYMKSRVGKTFNGIITGVTKWGLYVETIYERCEGMVRISTIGDDFYVLDEKSYSLVGERSKKRYRLGDEVKIRVARADLEKRQLDFELVT